MPNFDRIRYRRHDASVFLYAFDLTSRDVDMLAGHLGFLAVLLAEGLGLGDKFPFSSVVALWRPSIRAKAVVDAELHSGDGLLDVNPWHNFGNPKDRSGQC
jgi:hypothetical protein